MSDDERASDGAEAPLSDRPLLDLLDALVESRGKVAAAEALGVNYRTMTNCHDSRRVSRRMRRALQEFRDASGVAIEVGDGDDVSTDSQVEALSKRAAELEEENRELRELVEAQAVQLEALQGQISALEKEEHSAGDAERVGVAEVDGQRPPPRRGASPPNAGVVTLETQRDEEDAFGPAAGLVAEWRSLRNPAARRGSRVERAQTAVRRWELEVELLRDFHLTLPPETEPLDDSRRADHIRWRLEALAEARRELARAVRGRWVRRAVTLGLWWR